MGVTLHRTIRLEGKHGTVLDCEAVNTVLESLQNCGLRSGDVSVSISVEGFSRLLLESEDKEGVIEDFSRLDELRGEWFERELQDQRREGKKPDAVRFVRDVLSHYAEKYGLGYVED